MRRRVSQLPFRMPKRSSAISAYFEQVGSYLQQAGFQGEIQRR